MGVGWAPMDRDLQSVTTETELRKIYDAAYGDRATDQDFRQPSDFVLKMQVGDRVFVKRGTNELVGYGEVASGYLFDETRPEYRIAQSELVEDRELVDPRGREGVASEDDGEDQGP